ncbi:unnamed protein product [Closterium sp. NIES-54]
MVESDTPGEIDWETILPLHRPAEIVVSSRNPKELFLYDVNGRRSNALTNYQDSLSDDEIIPESEGYVSGEASDEMPTTDEMAEEEETDLSELVEWRVPTGSRGSTNRQGMRGSEATVQASGTQADQDEDYKEDRDSENAVAVDAMGTVMSSRERRGVTVRIAKDGDLDYEDVIRAAHDISMEITGDVSLAGIGTTSDYEDDWREEAAPSLQGYRYQYDSTGEQEHNFHNIPGVSAPGAGAGEGEDFDEFQQGAGGQPSTLAARGVDESGVSRADKQGHGKLVAEQYRYEDSDKVFHLEAAAVVDKRKAGEWDHDQMSVRPRTEDGAGIGVLPPLKGEAVLPARTDNWGLQENPLNVSVE